MTAFLSSPRTRQLFPVQLSTKWLKRGVTSEEAGDVAVCVDVYLACGGFCGEAGHGHDGAGFDDDEAGAVEEPDDCGADGEAGRAAEFVGVVGEGVLGFCDADGEVSGAGCFDLFDGSFGVC